METRVRTITPDRYDDVIEEAAGLLKQGRVVALPTETVYGLAAHRDDEAAMETLARLKERPPDKPFTLHLADAGEFERYARNRDPLAEKLMNRYWPGPLTLVVDAAAGSDIGMRVPGLGLTRDILFKAGVPVVLPSANPGGRTPARTAREVADYFSGRIDLVVDDGQSKIGDPSTVVRVKSGVLSVLRAGIISEADILQTACEKILFVCTGNTCRSPMAEGILKKLLAERLGCGVAELPYHGYLVQSAGLSALAGERAALHAMRALERWRIDLDDHRAQPISTARAAQADRIFIMTQSHKAALAEQLGNDLSNVELLDRNGKEITDPFGGSETIYARCASQIYTNLLEIVETL